MDSVVRRRWRLIALTVAAVTGLLYSLSGYAMASSFSVSNPERLSHWQHVAIVYLTLAAISAATALASMVALFQRARRSLRSDPPARITSVEPDERLKHPVSRQHPTS